MLRRSTRTQVFTIPENIKQSSIDAYGPDPRSRLNCPPYKGTLPIGVTFLTSKGSPPQFAYIIKDYDDQKKQYICVEVNHPGSYGTPFPEAAVSEMVKAPWQNLKFTKIDR